ncbi:MAG: hypothetical protein ACHQ53_06235 [Polyangiales bacterium]
MVRNEPTRWLDTDSGLPDTVREALRDARAEGPSAAQLERLISRLSTTTSGPASGHVSGPRFFPLKAARMLIAGGALLTAGALGAQFLRSQAAPAPHAGQARVTSPAAGTVESATPAAPPMVARPIGALAEPPTSVSERAAQKRLPRAPKPLENEIAGEVSLLRQSKRMLPSDPRRARELLRQHEQRYPNGVFVEEREALVVEALLGLGQVPEARARARSLRSRFPASPYLRRIDDLLHGPGGGGQ